MAHAVESHLVSDDIIPYPIGPYIEAPLADSPGFQFLYFWRWSKGVVLEPLNPDQDFLLNRAGEPLKVSLEARGEPNSKTGGHALASPAAGKSRPEVVPKCDGLPCQVFFRGDLEARLELWV